MRKILMISLLTVAVSSNYFFKSASAETTIPTKPQVLSPMTNPGFSHYQEGEDVAGFKVSAQYTNHEDEVVGLRLVHDESGLIIHLLQMDTVPQAAIAIHTYPQSDKGAAHALEHLLVGKGKQGRMMNLLADMRLSDTSAGTSEKFTWYHMYSGSGMESFYELLEQELKALFQPDFSDEEAVNEVYHFGVTKDPRTGKFALAEKGTVYTEISSNQGYYVYWRELLKMVLGKDHPMTFRGGGTPEAMRTLTAGEIRQYHREHYVLGKTTPMIIVIDRTQALPDFLKRIGTIIEPLILKQNELLDSQEIEKRVAIHSNTNPEVKIFPYPSQSKTDKSNILFGWKPVQIPSLKDRALLSTFLNVFGRGTQSILYRSLVDSKTRELETGATGVGMKDYETYSPEVPVCMFWVDGILGDQVNQNKLQVFRDHVQSKLKEVAGYTDGSKNLEEFNRKALSYLTAWQRSLKVWHSNPPGFGRRRTDTSWLEQLDVLDGEKDFRRSLVFKNALNEVIAEVRSGKNIWSRIIGMAELLDKPFGAASIPSPELLKQLEEEQQDRFAVKLASLKQQYQLRDEQEVLARFRAEIAKQDAGMTDLRNSIKIPRFTDHPSMTFDDKLQYSKLSWSGVPTIASYFEGSSRTDIGLAFDLRIVPRRLYKYLPLLPELVRSIGLKEGTTVTSYAELDEQIQRDIYNLDAHLSVSPEGHRYQLRVTGSGADRKEFLQALSYIKRITHSNNLNIENISRIKDLVDQFIREEDAFTKHYEEDWVSDLAKAFRYQSDHLYLSTSAKPTRAHYWHRLKWMLSDPIEKADLDALKLFSGEFLTKYRELDSTELVKILSGSNEKGIKGQLVKYWRARIKEMPSKFAPKGLAQLTNEVIADLSIGRETAINEMRELQQIVFNRAAMQAYLVGDRKVLNKARKDVESLYRAFKSNKTKIEFRENSPVLSHKISEREPAFKDNFPYAIGYVHEDSVNGNIVNSAKAPDYSARSKQHLIELVSANLLGGGGPHTLFMKTWEAGLAYSNGISVHPRDGTVRYYADRCPRIRETLNFAQSQTEDLSAYTNDYYIDYLLAQTFNFSRADRSYSIRGEAIATDLMEDVTPTKVNRFSQRLLALRKDKHLLADIKGTLPRVAKRVFLSSGDLKDKAQAQSILFFIAPEKQLKEIEDDAPGKGLYRLWRSDFWLD